MPKTKKDENPIAPYEKRKYVCSRWPQLHLGGGVRFKDGYFTSENEEQQQRVERADGYGSAILHIKHKPGRKPTVEEAAEMAAVEQLALLQPKAHRGMIGTRSSEVG